MHICKFRNKLNEIAKRSLLWRYLRDLALLLSCFQVHFMDNLTRMFCLRRAICFINHFNGNDCLLADIHTERNNGLGSPTRSHFNPYNGLVRAGSILYSVEMPFT